MPPVGGTIEREHRGADEPAPRYLLYVVSRARLPSGFLDTESTMMVILTGSPLGGILHLGSNPPRGEGMVRALPEWALAMV